MRLTLASGAAMAGYKYDWAVEPYDGEPFDDFHAPDAPAPEPGIYQCHGCGREIAIAGGKTLPPQNHHQHSLKEGLIAWRLVVIADGRSTAERG